MGEEETFSQEEREILRPFVSTLEGDVFVLTNLPEVIKGALFSRYSRAQKGIRKLLLDEFILNPDLGIVHVKGFAQDNVLAVKKAQEFYDRVLDGFGDDSIGELGGAHIAIENISMYATKVIEDCRIGGSPLEKSSRYVLFNKKINGSYQYYKDPAIMASDLAEEYVRINDLLFDTYSELVEPMTKFFTDRTPQQEGVPDAAYKASVRAQALDSIRALLPLCALTNMGMFGNGRFFETALMKLRVHQMAELSQLGASMHAELDKVIPSFVRRAWPDNKHFGPFRSYHAGVRDGMADLARQVVEPMNHCEEVTLVSYDAHAENKTLAVMLYPYLKLPLAQLVRIVEMMGPDRKKELIARYIGDRTNRRHKPGRALEIPTYTFDICSNYGVYKDLERHRILTQEKQEISALHGYEVPLDIIRAGHEIKFREAMDEVKPAWEKIAARFPREAQYVVPQGYKIRWYMHANLRALMWLCELRSIPQGHPDYRKVAQKMAQRIIEVHPAFSDALKFVDMEDYSLGRLAQEIKAAKKKQSLPQPVQK
ncbi:MAG: FAD-dependent thymidylate synthase [Nanoarchaeota archaeon]